MSGVFNLIDRQKLLSGEADYGAGQYAPRPASGLIQWGLSSTLA